MADTCTAGGDIDSEEEVTKSIHDSVVEVRVGLFPILTIKSLNSLRIALDTSAVDCLVEDVLPDSVRMGLLTVRDFHERFRNRSFSFIY